MNWFKILPFLFRYNRSYKREFVDPIRAITYFSLLHILIFAWMWVFADREVPEYIFVGFGTIAGAGMAADVWKTKIKNKDHDL